MFSTSSLRDRRLANRQIELKQQFVIFWIRQAWFAIPIASMHRAIPLETDIPTITQAGIEIPIIDIGKLIFVNQTISEPIDKSLKSQNRQFGKAEISAQRSLLLLQRLGQQKSLIGILIDSQPVLLRILDSEFMALPDHYQTNFGTDINFDLISSVTPSSSEDHTRPQIFGLNPNAIADLSSFLHKN